ncbi:MAG: ATP-binding protein [Myxococcota bacterium]|nr:ATP-binding protein [Myxococcota bacterium]
MTFQTEAQSKDVQRVLDAMMQGVVIVSPEGYVRLINHEACRILEAASEGAQSRDLASLVPGNHRILSAVEKVRNSQQSRAEGEVVLRRRSGTEVLLDITLSPVSDDESGAPGVLIVLRDRTAFKELSDDDSLQKQLSAYGHIAAGIAHEVKNPLGGIRGAAELLQKRSADERSERTAHLIIQEVDRITALVDELMVFARAEALSCESVNLHRLLNQMIELLSAEPLASHVEFNRIFDPSIPEIPGDPSRLTQVFLNLARNAIQAMGESGGRLTLTTSISLQNRLAGEDGRGVPTVNIVFEDEGPGIDEEILERLATPFFTTKADGTGLGLAVSRHWISRHRGKLLIDGQGPEGGARVCVKLPLKQGQTRPSMEI